jgi:hypothetical protein
MPKKRILGWVLVGLAAATVLALSVAEVSTRISRRRAERLLHDLRQLQVGKSTFEDARAVILRHGGGVSPRDHSGCSPGHCTFEVALTHYPLLMEAGGRSVTIGMVYHLFRVFPPLGLQDWVSQAEVGVVGGFVVHLRYTVFVRGRSGWILGRDAEEFEAIPEYLRDRTGQRSYYLHWFLITDPGGGRGIESVVTPMANAEERNRAYDFDFDCLTKVGGCSSLCQFAPSAFADFVKETGKIPYPLEHDPNCAKFKPLERNPNNAAHP